MLSAATARHRRAIVGDRCHAHRDRFACANALGEPDQERDVEVSVIQARRVAASQVASGMVAAGGSGGFVVEVQKYQNNVC